MKNLFVLGLWYGQGYSCQNHPLERNENVHATRSAQIQNRSRRACAAVPKALSYFLFCLLLKKSWQLCKQPAHAKVTSLQQIPNKQFRAGDWYSAGKSKLFLRCHCCLLPDVTLPGQLKHVLSPALCGVPGFGTRRPVRLMQSPALLHRTALNPHKVWGAEEHGRAWGLPPYGFPRGWSASVP